MSRIDLVFEGGGAKGAVFVGALEVLFGEHGHTHGRLLGTSAGAITAVLLAAGYSVAEMHAALAEKDEDGKPVFSGFLATPTPFDQEEIRYSLIRNLLRDLNMPLFPDSAEDRVDDWIAEQLASRVFSRHVFSFLERGGWFGADPFVRWLERKLDQPRPDGTPRALSKLTFSELLAATGAELSLVAADTTWARGLLLNHRTAPDCPVVWAARMSMSVPLLWQEVEWKKEWGPYHAWDPDQRCLAPADLTGHTIVDGGLLSNFPIGLFLSDRPDVLALVGPSSADAVLGLLIDESLDVPDQPSRPAHSGLGAARSRPIDRLRRLMTTATAAHDNVAIAAYARHVVHLPAGGYGTTEFDMEDQRREALVSAGRRAMRDFMAGQRALTDPIPGAGVGDAEKALANQAPAGLLRERPTAGASPAAGERGQRKEMAALEAIRTRRSIRRFAAAAVPKADLETIVDAGRLAATGSNRQPWDFIVVTDPAMIGQFAVSGAWLAHAPAVIVVVMDPRSRWWIEDGAAAIENMLVAATALGYGSCWVEGDALPHEERLKALLGVPTDRRVLALLPIGVPAEAPSPQKKPMEHVLHWDRY
jgi:nitroreductase/predicted acylesterase/phospholipase RssA